MKLNDIAKQYKVKIVDYIAECGEEGLYRMANSYISTDKVVIEKITEWCKANEPQVKVKVKKTTTNRTGEMMKEVNERLNKLESSIGKLTSMVEQLIEVKTTKPERNDEALLKLNDLVDEYREIAYRAAAENEGLEKALEEVKLENKELKHKVWLLDGEVEGLKEDLNHKEEACKGQSRMNVRLSEELEKTQNQLKEATELVLRGDVNDKVMGSNEVPQAVVRGDVEDWVDYLKIKDPDNLTGFEVDLRYYMLLSDIEELPNPKDGLTRSIYHNPEYNKLQQMRSEAFKFIRDRENKVEEPTIKACEARKEIKDFGFGGTLTVDRVIAKYVGGAANV